MNFAAAWSASTVGDYLSISNGQPMPSVVGGFPWRLWRSHNFVGRLVEKGAGPAGQRMMLLELAPHAGAKIAYSVHETAGHTFAPSDAATFATDVFNLL